MLGERFHGQAALVLHVDRAMPDRPQVLCSARSESGMRRPLHISTTLLRSVMERGYASLLEPLSYSNVSPPMFLWMTKFRHDAC